MTIDEKNRGQMTPEQMSELGYHYYNGENGFTQDKAEAYFWWRKAAEQGIVKSQVLLGHLYKDGIIVQQDYEEAMWWWQRAAESGNLEALHQIGWCYAEGL
jgi:TPR repeat protein